MSKVVHDDLCSLGLAGARLAEAGRDAECIRKGLKRRAKELNVLLTKPREGQPLNYTYKRDDDRFVVKKSMKGMKMCFNVDYF